VTSPVSRHTASELASVEAGLAVEFLGRKVAEDSGLHHLRDETGRVEVAWGDAVPLGAWLRVRGTWDGARLHAEEVEVHGLPASDFPDPRGDWAWLHDADGRRMQILHARARMLRTVHQFFERRSFLEVPTAAVVPSPGLELHLDAFEVDAAEAPRFLITSPEYQMKRLLSAGVPRIYQVARCFRRGELGPLHEPEFTMVEWYRSFAASEDVMTDTEELVAHVTRTALHHTRVPGRGREVDVSPPWDRLTVAEAYQRYAGVDLATVADDDERFFRIMVEDVQPQLGRERPVFLTHWPLSMASLARARSDDPTVADRFEGFVDGVEICNGFGELTDPVEQRARLRADADRRRAEGRPVYPIDERFLEALAQGLPPSGGNALGFDRLVMLVLGVDEVADVQPIPWRRL